MLTKTRIGNHLRRHALGDQPTFRQGFKEGVAFAQKHAAPVQTQSEPVPKGVLLALSNAGLMLIKTQHGYEVRKLGQITAQAAPVQQEKQK